MVKALYQVRLETYLYKYAITLEYYNSENDTFEVPFILQLPTPNGSKPVTYYFERIEKLKNTRVLLVHMQKGSKVKQYAFVQYLRKKFVEDLHSHLIVAKGFSLSATDCILAYIKHYGITPDEYSLERAKRAWTRKQNKLKNNKKFNFLCTDGIRQAPKREYRGDLSDSDI